MTKNGRHAMRAVRFFVIVKFSGLTGWLRSSEVL